MIPVRIHWDREGAARVGLPSEFRICDCWHYLDGDARGSVQSDDVHLRLEGYDPASPTDNHQTHLFWPENYRQTADYLLSKGWERY